MAGGMHRGRSGRSLGDRAASSGVPGSGPPPVHEPVPAAPGDGGEGRHCWVRDPPGCPGVRPGLLVEWRQRDGAWQGRVTYTVAGPHGVTLVEAWLPATRLEPR